MSREEHEEKSQQFSNQARSWNQKDTQTYADTNKKDSTTLTNYKKAKH